MAERHGTANVLITSIDGNVSHPFRWDQTVGDVRRFGYDRLVNDKNQISFNNTWMEQGGNRLDDGTELSNFAEDRKQPGNVPDLTLNLAWTQQGGAK